MAETETVHVERRPAVLEAEVKGNKLIGYAGVFDTPWDPALIEKNGYSESLARGAFRKALVAVNEGRQNVPLTWQHDFDKVLATTRSGNLKVKEDGKGLYVEAKLPDTTLGRDVRELIETRTVGGMSYGRELRHEDSRLSKVNGIYHRTVNNVRKLLDVTLTWEPSFPEALVELRSAGFAALPLQELLDGREEQIEQAVTEDSSIAMLPYRNRVREIERQIIEGGGIQL